MPRITAPVWKAGSMPGVLSPATCLHSSVHAHQSTLPLGSLEKEPGGQVTIFFQNRVGLAFRLESI